jgi:hypothetical protein
MQIVSFPYQLSAKSVEGVQAIWRSYYIWSDAHLALLQINVTYD